MNFYLSELPILSFIFTRTLKMKNECTYINLIDRWYNNYLSPCRITIIEYGDMVHAQDIEAGG